MSRRLSADRLKTLEAAYCAGKMPFTAAREAGCSYQTARNKFYGFKCQGLPRAIKPKRKPRGHITPYEFPRYTGPDIIGKAIPSVLPTDGWIGKRA